jgi:hypothetical protein
MTILHLEEVDARGLARPMRRLQAKRALNGLRAKSAKVEVDAACCQRAMEGLPLFTVMPLVTSPMNAIAQSILCSTSL